MKLFLANKWESLRQLLVFAKSDGGARDCHFAGADSSRQSNALQLDGNVRLDIYTGARGLAGGAFDDCHVDDDDR